MSTVTDWGSKIFRAVYERKKKKPFINSFPAAGTDSAQETGDGIYLNVMKNEDRQGPVGHYGKQ